MSFGWQDVVVVVITALAIAFLYRHFRPRRGVVAVIPASALRVRQKHPPTAGKDGG